MLIVTKVVAAGVTALALGGAPSPNMSLVERPVPASSSDLAQTLAQTPCTSGCNVWRLMYDGR